MYGPERMLKELETLGHEAMLRTAGSMVFVVLTGYEILLGRFAGKRVDLGLPAVPDFPRSVGASIHVRALPPLLDKGNVPNVRNVTDSPLGDEWQYWSHNFQWQGERERSASRLLAKVNAVFERA